MLETARYFWYTAHGISANSCARMICGGSDLKFRFKLECEILKQGREILKRG